MTAIRTGVDYQNRPLNIFALGLAQDVAFNNSGGAITLSTAFSETTYAVMISVDKDDVVRFRIGTGDPDFTDGSTKVTGPALLIFTAPAGGKIAVRGGAAGTGSVNVTEIVGYARQGA
jgi:hypothetical protein